MLCFVNNQFIPEDDVLIPLKDRGFLFGDGIFTTLKVSNGCIEAYPLHKERFLSQAKALNLPPPAISPHTIHDLLAVNKAQTGSWRLKWILTAGSSPERNGLFIMMLSPYNEVRTPLKLAIYPHPLSSPLHRFKTLAYLERFWIQEFAMQQGCEDALVVDPHGHILETAFANLFWIHDSRWFTPASSLPILKGITLQILMQAFDIKEVEVTLSQIPSDTHPFSCNSLQGIRAITSIGNRSFPVNLSLETTIRQHHFSLTSRFIQS